jgi:hypothetical protein
MLEALHEAAWEAASTTGALRLLDYRTAALMSETYLVQRSGIPRTMERVASTVYDPRAVGGGAGSTLEMVRVLALLMNELSGQESYLLETYRRVLRELPPPTD